MGLGVARVVEKATEAYRQESDHYGRFLAECCTSGLRDEVSGSELFDAYVQWCSRVKERPESNNTFAKALLDRGIQKKRRKKGVAYIGIGLRPQVKIAKLISEEGSANGTV